MLVVLLARVLSVLRFWLSFCVGFFLGLISFYMVWTPICYTAYTLGLLAV